MKTIVTGAAGFIGSHIVDRLLSLGHEVIGIDNYSTGKKQFLVHALQDPKFVLFETDLLSLDAIKKIFREDIDHVFHLAANADVRFGLENPRRDLEQGTLVTWNVLEAMRCSGIRSVTFTSTGSVYGEPLSFPTPENAPFPVQTSLYAASKLAAEGLISAYAVGYGMHATIFRFVSFLGDRYTHGHVYDFIMKLNQDPSQVSVLGNGKQRKSYIHVEDGVDAIIHLWERKGTGPVDIYNLGTDSYVTVDESLNTICDELGLNPIRKYSGEERGWVGDSPFIFLDCSKLKATGWKANHTIEFGIRSTVRFLTAHPELFPSPLKIKTEARAHL